MELQTLKREAVKRVLQSDNENVRLVLRIFVMLFKHFSRKVLIFNNSFRYINIWEKQL